MINFTSLHFTIYNANKFQYNGYNFHFFLLPTAFVSLILYIYIYLQFTDLCAFQCTMSADFVNGVRAHTRMAYSQHC